MSEGTFMPRAYIPTNALIRHAIFISFQTNSHKCFLISANSFVEQFTNSVVLYKSKNWKFLLYLIFGASTITVTAWRSSDSYRLPDEWMCRDVNDDLWTTGRRGINVGVDQYERMAIIDRYGVSLQRRDLIDLMDKSIKLHLITIRSSLSSLPIPYAAIDHR